MTREAAVTQEEINNIANALQAAGARPSVRTVRERAGRGSMATVLRLLQNWQNAQAKPAQQEATIPPALQRSLAEFIASEVKAARAELLEDLAAAQQVQGDLVAESERLTRLIDAQEQTIEALHATTAELQGRSSQIEAELNTARQELANERDESVTIKTNLATARAQLDNVPKLEAEIVQLRSQLAEESRARVAAEQTAAVSAARLEAMSNRATTAEERANRLEADLRQSAQVADTSRRDASDARLAAQASATKTESVLRELDALRAQIAIAQNEAVAAKKGATEPRAKQGERAPTRKTPAQNSK